MIVRCLIINKEKHDDYKDVDINFDDWKIGGGIRTLISNKLSTDIYNYEIIDLYCIDEEK